MTLMLTLGTAAFGAQKTLPSGKDTGSINVTNLKPGDTVTAYQFVKADYNEYGFTGYSAINNYVKDPVAPTAQEVIDMASNAATMTVAAEKKVATGDTEVTLNGLPVGYYLVMVTSGSETVYSPMIAGIYYSKSATDNTLTNGAISADSDFEIKAQKCWAKSSTPKLEKTTYKIYDIMSEGLDYVDGSMKCFIEKYENNRENIKVTPKVNGGIIEITFDSKFILEHPGQKIQVEYQAKLNEKAGVNFDANINKAYLEYSNNPASGSTAKTGEDKVYVYTFGIGSNLFGKSTEKWNEKTKELIKVEEGEYQWVETEKESGIFTTTTALEGATFTLTNNKTKKSYTATSDKYGYLKFTGLDAGEYTLQETDAPDGFTLNDAKHTVVITAEYNQDGTLKSYTIKIDDKATSTYTATYDKGVIKTITSTKDSQGNISESAILKNSKMSFLPSTGGVGTTIFAIVGVVFVVVALGLHMILRGKSKLEQDR